MHWAPRILGIAAILFISLFALDAFQSDLKFTRQIKDFFIHLIPAYVLIGTLILAWKKELVGGAIFMLFALVLAPWLFQHNYAMSLSFKASLVPVLCMALPFFLIGVMFIWSYFTTHHIHSEF